LIRVLSNPWAAEELAILLMRETGTLGVRLMDVPRMVAERDLRTVRLELLGRSYEIRVKVSSIGGKVLSVKPEYDDLVRISREAGIPLRRVEDYVRSRLAGSFWGGR
ncbi:MAG: DUF111 family protein, partial [Candidatus Korarchaeota archaeon]|nr:DUF111 family protein [Candidatus Korarchaeota archaeon]